MTWRRVVDSFARENDVDGFWTEALDCMASPFPRGGPPGPPELPWSGSFADLERATLPRPRVWDVDPEQAAIFDRRIDAVVVELGAVGGPEGRILSVGLKVRLAGIAAATGPVAVRVRALADLYYSLAAQLRSMRSGRVRPLPEALECIRWRWVDGVEHGVLDGAGPMGPMHINILRIDPDRFEPKVVDLRGTDGDLGRIARQRGAVAATSGGFFLYSEPDIEAPSERGDPVGLWVAGGQVHNPPWLPRGALVAGPGWVDVGVVGVDGLVHTRAMGKIGPPVPSIAVVGTAVVAEGTRLPIPLNGAVLEGVSSFPELRITHRGRRVHEGVAGGPMLVRAGRPCVDLRSEGFWGSAPPVTFSQDETGDRNLLPRLAAGVDRQGRIVLCAVDGRNFTRALGMTLAQLAECMIELGCDRAVNLDGGSSKRMVVEGREVDLPSTEVRSGAAKTVVRPVRTGIVWLSRSSTRAGVLS